MYKRFEAITLINNALRRFFLVNHRMAVVKCVQSVTQAFACKISIASVLGLFPEGSM